MKKQALLLSLSSMLFVPSAFAELTMLNDGVMSGISGQSGITLDLDLHLEAAEIAYFDDGAGIAIQGVKISGAPIDHGESTSDPASMQYVVDIEADGTLNVGYDISLTRFEFSDIRLGTEAGNMSGPSGGGFFWDSQVVGNLKLKAGGALSADGYTFESDYTLTNGAFGYVTQGNRFWLDDIDSTFQSIMTLDVATDARGNYLDINLDHYTGEYSVGAIRHSSDPTKSGGALWGQYDKSSNIKLRGGGRVGVEGLTLDIQNTIPNQADLILLIILGIFFTALPHSLFAYSLRSIKAKTVSIIASMQPLYATIFGIIILDEIPLLKTIIGGILIVSCAMYESFKLSSE